MTGYYNRSGRLVHDSGPTRDRIIAEYRDPALPGTRVTVDEHGDVRRGPTAAWWTRLLDRPSTPAGITPELPSPRAWAWNLLAFVVEASAVAWAHSQGLAWVTIAAALGGVLLLGAAGLAYVICVHTPRALRRHQALLRSYLDDPTRLDAAADPERGASSGRDSRATARTGRAP